MARQIRLTGLICLQAVGLMLLAGCWTPPNANVQPRGEPRLIQSGVSVERTDVPATVQTVGAARVLNLVLADGTPLTCTVSPQVKNLDQVQAGDAVKVTLAEKLAVYVLKDGKLPGADGTETVLPVIARVQVVDPSYRLLTLQYPNGRTEVLKASLDAKLSEMHPGDSVTLESAEALKIKVVKNK